MTQRPVGCGTPGVHDPLGNALVIEVGDLLAQMEVLEQRGSALTGFERMVGIRQPNTLGRGEKVPALGDGFRAVLRGLAGRGECGGAGMIPTVGAWHAICSDSRQRRSPTACPYPPGWSSDQIVCLL